LNTLVGEMENVYIALPANKRRQRSVQPCHFSTR